MFTRRCFNCSQVGHQASRCPEKGTSQHGSERRVNLTHEEDTQSSHEERGVAYLEQGESLMFNRTLLKNPQVKEPPQRKTLFKTTCKVKGKVCKVIIDFDSTDNLASISMVENLGLKNMPHPNPYKVSWLNKE